MHHQNQMEEILLLVTTLKPDLNFIAQYILYVDQHTCTELHEYEHTQFSVQQRKKAIFTTNAGNAAKTTNPAYYLQFSSSFAL